MSTPNRRRRRGIAAVLAIVLAVLVAFWGLTYTPLFAAREIRIRGNRQLSDARVQELAGVSSETNVVHLDEAALETGLLADPWVAGVEVDAQPPDTLVITIEERRAVGMIDALGHTAFLANDGTALPVGGVRVGTLPTVRAGVGALNAAQRLAAASLLNALLDARVRGVDGVQVGQDGVVTLHLRPDVTVDTGRAGEEAEKARTLQAVLRWAAGEGLAVRAVDVSTPAAPSVTLVDGSSVTP